MAIGSAVAVLPIVILARLPSAVSWLYIPMSVALYTSYNLFLVHAYRVGDFGQSYPIAYGSSPLLVPMEAALFAGEEFSMSTLVGVALTFSGIIRLAQICFGRSKTACPERSGDTPLTVSITGVFIAGYIIVDGLGSCMTGSAVAGGFRYVSAQPGMRWEVAPFRCRHMAF